MGEGVSRIEETNQHKDGAYRNVRNLETQVDAGCGRYSVGSARVHVHDKADIYPRGAAKDVRFSSDRDREDTARIPDATTSVASAAHNSTTRVCVFAGLLRRTHTATMADLVRANWAAREVQNMMRKEHCVKFRKACTFSSKAPMVLGIHDASFDRQPRTGSQLGYVIVVTNEEALKTPQPCHTIDWSSARIHRMVRSTFASEAVAASHAFDRQQLDCAALSGFLCGQHAASDWVERSYMIKGGFDTDCHSLFQSCQKCTRCR